MKEYKKKAEHFNDMTKDKSIEEVYKYIYLG